MLCYDYIPSVGPPQNTVNGTFQKRSTNGTQPLIAHLRNQPKNAQISIDL